jgi:hypothetical protein
MMLACVTVQPELHIFTTVFTKPPTIPDIAMHQCFWFERALDMFRPGTGIGGFSRYARRFGSSASTWEASPDLLDGSIGVALALLGAVSSIEPQWDRLLLLSSRAQ